MTMLHKVKKLNIKELIEKQEEEIKSFMDDIDAIIVEKNSTKKLK